jgi:hypothetical protein
MAGILLVHRSSQRNQNIIVIATFLTRHWFAGSEKNNDENEDTRLFAQNSKLVNSEQNDV